MLFAGVVWREMGVCYVGIIVRYSVWKYKPESGFAGFFGIFRIRAVLDGVGVPGRVFTSVCVRLRALSGAGFAGLLGFSGFGPSETARVSSYKCLTRDYECLREFGECSCEII